MVMKSNPIPRLQFIAAGITREESYPSLLLCWYILPLPSPKIKKKRLSRSFNPHACDRLTCNTSLCVGLTLTSNDVIMKNVTIYLCVWWLHLPQWRDPCWRFHQDCWPPTPRSCLWRWCHNYIIDNYKHVVLFIQVSQIFELLMYSKRWYIG